MLFAVRADRSNRVVYREVEQIPTRLQQVFRNGFFSFMKALQKRANDEILRGTKTGRVYRIRTASGTRRHRASAPGETHANMRGGLRRSLSWRVHGWEKAEFGYGVSTSAKNKAPGYAAYVEFGTRRMKARPSLQNAIRDEEPEGHFERAFDEKFTR